MLPQRRPHPSGASRGQVVLVQRAIDGPHADTGRIVQGLRSPEKRRRTLRMSLDPLDPRQRDEALRNEPLVSLLPEKSQAFFQERAGPTGIPRTILRDSQVGERVRLARIVCSSSNSAKECSRIGLARSYSPWHRAASPRLLSETATPRLSPISRRIAPLSS